MVYVSITGLRLKSSLHVIRFWHLAFASMRQALKAPGNLRAEAHTINGVHHTLTVWESEAHMRAFLMTGAHLKAMKLFRKIATGKTIGYLSQEVPEWHDVHDIWLTKGRDV
jgi:quinol monooxygenase YgiN